jgi:hypothetical protein
MTISWDALLAVCALTTIFGAVLWLLIRTSMDSALKSSENRLATKIHAEYVPREMCLANMKLDDNRIDRLEQINIRLARLEEAVRAIEIKVTRLEVLVPVATED